MVLAELRLQLLLLPRVQVSIPCGSDFLQQLLGLIFFLLYQFLDVEHLVFELPDLQLGGELLLLGILGLLPALLLNLRSSTSYLLQLLDFLLLPASQLFDFLLQHFVQRRVADLLLA